MRKFDPAKFAAMKAQVQAERALNEGAEEAFENPFADDEADEASRDQAIIDAYVAAEGGPAALAAKFEAEKANAISYVTVEEFLARFA